jgi:hypothetical protein
MASRQLNDDEHESTENILNVLFILESMCQPQCWNIERKDISHGGGISNNVASPIESPCIQRFSGLVNVTLSTERTLNISHFTHDVFFLSLLEDDSCIGPELKLVGKQMDY